jgi:hypothetical protein
MAFTYPTIVPRWWRGETATTSGNALSDSGADFSQVVDGDAGHLLGGAGITPGAYVINSHTSTSLTFSSAPGNSTGDVEYIVYLRGNDNAGVASDLDDTYILQLRTNVNIAGEAAGMHSYSANWDANAKYQWTKGSTTALVAGESRIYTSYLTDLRTAIEEMATKQGLSAPSWGIASGSITELWAFDGSVIDADVAAAHDCRRAVFWEEVQDELDAVAVPGSYWVDSVNGNDTTGTGTEANPWKTWNKGITELNSSGGILIFEAGAYTCDKVLAKNNSVLQGIALGDVILNYDDSTSYPVKGNDITISNMHFLQPSDSTSSAATWFDTADNLNASYCVFRTERDAFNVAAMLMRNSDDVVFNHCTITGVNNDSATGNRGLYLLETVGTMNAEFKNCVIGNCRIGADLGNYDTIFTNCGFYDNYDDHTGTAPTFTNTWHDGDSSNKNPYIQDWSYPLLGDTYKATNEFIGSGTDGKDRGAYHGVYNFTRLAAAETIVCNDPTIVDKTKTTISETLAVQDWDNNNALVWETMNLTVEMLLGGLFRCDVDADITYIDADELTNMTYTDGDNNWLGFESDITSNYNGAGIDVKLDTPVNNHKLYVTAEIAGVDYTELAWWEAHKANNTGTGTTTTFINAWKDCRTTGEWGSEYIKTLSDNPTFGNRYQMDVTLKIRALRESDGVWSELVTLSKNYDFGEFSTSIYYCADNPRAVDDEYANHANYYAQIYHSGTDKYTNPAGTNWIDDDRRFIYNPITKSNLLMHGRIRTDGTISTQQEPSWEGDPGDWLNVWNSWAFHKQIDTIHSLGELHIPYFAMYASIGSNFGGWSDGHVFADITNQVSDRGIKTVTAPLLANDLTKYHHIFSFFSQEGDCTIHNSYPELYSRLPSGENIVTGLHTGKLRLIDDFDFDLATDTSHSPCSDTDFWFRAKDNILGRPTVYRQTSGVYTGWAINTNQQGLSAYGAISLRYANPNSSNVWQEFW